MILSVKEQTKRLWQDTFGDTADFVDLYFDRIYTDSINHTVRLSNGVVVSALQAIEMPFKVDDKIFRTAYISGVATDKNYRRCGYMSQLLESTHRELMSAGIDAVWLIPDSQYLFDVYAKFGYRTAFYKSYRTINVAPSYRYNDLTVSEINRAEVDAAFEYFQRKQMEQEAGVLLTRDFFGVVVDNFILENNPMYLHRTSGEISGLVFAYSNGTVLKLFADSPDIEQDILYCLARRMGRNSIIVKTNEKETPYGMMLFFNRDTDISEYLPQVSLMLDE
mgnify:FL=1